MSERPESERPESERPSALRLALQSYGARARFPIVAVCALVLALVPGLGAFRGDPDAQRYGYIVGTPLLMVWVGLVSGHLKQVLARPETRLVPGFARTQLLAAAMILLPACALSMLASWAAGLSVLSSCALAALATSLCWAVPYLFRGGTVVVFLGPSAFWLLGTPLPDETVSVPGGSAVLAASLALIAWVTYRMSGLNESLPEYGRDPTMAWRRGLRPDRDRPFSAFLATYFPWLGYHELTGLSSRFEAGFWRRVQLWRMGMTRSSAIVAGISLAFFLSVVGFVFVYHPENSGRVQTGVLVIYIVFFPLSRAAYARRRPDRVEYELLYPASREKILKEIGVAQMVDLVQTWFFFIVGTLIGHWLGAFPLVSWGSLISYSVYSLGAVILGSGLVMWLYREWSDWLSALLLYLGTLAIAAPLALVLARGPGTEAVAWWAAGAAILAVIGVAIGHGAYRHWCRLELGRAEFSSG